MGKVTLKRKNVNLPAPKFWRKIEDALLILIIPAVVMVLTNWGFADEKQLNRILLLVNILLVAFVKAFGLFLANGQIYANENKDGDIGGGNVPPIKDEK